MNKYILIIFFLIAINCLERQKCLYFKDKFRVSCGNIQINEETPSSSFADVEWYYSNSRMMQAFAGFCPTYCQNLEEEMFYFEMNKKYKFSYTDGKIWIKNTIDEDDKISVTTTTDCLLCILRLYTNSVKK